MKTVIISPYSQKLRNEKRNPKNFPHWKSVLQSLLEKNIKVIQIGTAGEEPLGATEFLTNLPLHKLEELVHTANTWASVDNFLPHLCNTIGKSGVVVFGASDPAIFGYPQNINLLKDRSHLRQFQYDIWEAIEYNENVFVSPHDVVNSIVKLLKE